VAEIQDRGRRFVSDRTWRWRGRLRVLLACIGIVVVDRRQTIGEPTRALKCRDEVPACEVWLIIVGLPRNKRTRLSCAEMRLTDGCGGVAFETAQEGSLGMNERVRSRIDGSSYAIRHRGVGFAIALVVAVLSTISATALATSDGADRNIDNEFAVFYAGFLEIPLDDASRQVGDMLDFYQSEFGVDREEAEVQARLDLLGGDVRELAYK